MKLFKNMGWRIFAILGILSFVFSSESYAESGGKSYFGAGAGIIGKDETMTAFGAALGTRISTSAGIGAFVNRGSKSGISLLEFGGEVDLFPSGSNAFYIGPRIGSIKFVSTSALIYGAGIGINLGQRTTFGVDFSYKFGSIAGTSFDYYTLLANVKFWN